MQERMLTQSKNQMICKHCENSECQEVAICFIPSFNPKLKSYFKLYSPPGVDLRGIVCLFGGLETLVEAELDFSTLIRASLKHNL